MTPAQRELAKQYLQRWTTLGPELERIRIEEVRAMTLTQRQQAIQRVLTLPAINPRSRFTSGLIEQQRYFRNAPR